MVTISDRKHKFMIIDDHPLIRDGIRSFIVAHERFEFIGEFEDTRSVLNSHIACKPDIIILDLSLKGIDGGRSLPLLKRKFPECKVVAFTQHEELHQELKKIGFDGYITKNERDLLVEALDTVIRGEKYFRNINRYTQHAAPEAQKKDDYLKWKQLTPREMEVAKYMKDDFTNREIAAQIFISEDTVKTHRKHIKEKLCVKSKRDLSAVLRTIEFPDTF